MPRDVTGTSRVGSADMDAHLLDRYATLVVRVGANVQQGQDVYIRADIEHAPVAQAITEQAYLAGARRVVVTYDDALVRRSALRHAPMDSLTSVPGWQEAQLAEMVADGAATIRLTGNADPHVFEGIDPARLAAVPREFAVASRKALLGGSLPWTIVAAPSPGWATQVFGEPDVDRLWDAVSVAMRL